MADLSDRMHKGLYALYIGAQRLERQNLTTEELFDFAGEFNGVTLLKSKDDTAAILAELRERGLAEKDGQDGRSYYNKLTDEGLDVLEELGIPEGVE